MDNIAKIIRFSKSFLITTHALPDGDGLGSEMALYYYLKSIGKQCVVMNTHETPAKFQIVDPEKKIEVFEKGKALPTVDLVLVVDTNEMRMLGPLEAPIRALQTRTIFIDHHVSQNLEPGEHLIEESYGSTGELAHTLLKRLGAKLDLSIATALYVAILTDTAGFRFKRTTSRSHEIAAELLAIGVAPETIYRAIYAQDSLAKVRLLGQVLQGIQSSKDEKIAWLVIGRDMRKKAGASIEDTESFVNHLTLIDGVEIGVLFREEDNGVVKVSLRGNGEAEVWPIADHFSGGGHRFAAGMRIEGKLDDVIQKVLEQAHRVLEPSAPKSKSG